MEEIKTQKLGSFRKALYDKVSEMLGRDISKAEYRTLHVLMVALYDAINNSVPKTRVERVFRCVECRKEYIKPSRKGPMVPKPQD